MRCLCLLNGYNRPSEGAPVWSANDGHIHIFRLHSATIIRPRFRAGPQYILATETKRTIYTHTRCFTTRRKSSCDYKTAGIPFKNNKEPVACVCVTKWLAHVCVSRRESDSWHEFVGRHARCGFCVSPRNIMRFHTGRAMQFAGSR